MRLLSSIIKNSDLVIANPRVIETVLKLEEEKTTPESFVTESDPIQALQLESQSILAETETLIVELLEKARTEANGIIQDAKEEAEYIRSQTMEESVRIKEDALNQGYGEGLRKAQQDIEADRQMAMDQSRQIVEEARRTKMEILNSLEPDMVRLVLAIAKKVVVADLILQPAAIVEIIRQAIANLDEPENLRIYLNPADVSIVIDAIDWDGLTEIGSRDIPVEVKSDSRISRGGAMIESSGGTVDARLETRLENVEKSFMDVVNE